MNAAHQHLLINHFPIIGLILAVLILLIGILAKSPAARMSGLLLFLIAGVTALIANSTGEGAEEVFEHLPGANHQLIHEHEEHAESLLPFMWGIIFLSIIALILEWKRKSMAMIASVTVLLIGMIAVYFAKETSKSGGEIAHPEVRRDFVEPEHEGHED